MQPPKLLHLTTTIIHLLIILPLTLANVEKQVFLAPAPTPTSKPTSLPLSTLHHLTPTNPTLRTKLHSAFPHSARIPGIPSTAHYILADLIPGARYEVRICWAAVQPTSFVMDVIQDAMRDAVQDSGVNGMGMGNGSSWVVLAVEARADYFSMDQGLMRDGLVVDVDIVLDEYIWGVVPRSLLPTGLHIFVVAVLAGVVVWVLLWHLDGVVDAEVDLVGKEKEKRKKKKVV